MFSSINKTFGCCSKIFGCSNKNLFVVPNFVAVTKPLFFPWKIESADIQAKMPHQNNTRNNCTPTWKLHMTHSTRKKIRTKQRERWEVEWRPRRNHERNSLQFRASVALGTLLNSLLSSCAVRFILCTEKINVLSFFTGIFHTRKNKLALSAKASMQHVLFIFADIAKFLPAIAKNLSLLKIYNAYISPKTKFKASKKFYDAKNKLA